MSYIDKSLAPGETIILRTRPHWVLWLRAWLSLLVLGWILIGIYFFVRDVLFLISTEIAVTSRRLIFKTGLLQRHTSELVLNSIETMRIQQGILGRILGFGRVHVHGTGTEVWGTPLIGDPVGFRRAIGEARGKALGL